jgi:hypothetical protein
MSWLAFLFGVATRSSSSVPRRLSVGCRSTYQGIRASFDQSITNVLFDTVTIDGAGSNGIEIDATGSATFNDVTVTGAATAASTVESGFTVTRGAEDTGW